MASRKWFVPARTKRSRNTWCGPYVAAVLAGVDYDDAYAATLKVTRRRAVTGMRNAELLAVLDSYGVSTVKLPSDQVYEYEPYTIGSGPGGYTVRGHRMKNMTLTQWYKQRPNKTATYIVQVTGHFLVVRGTRVIDNQFAEWLPFAKRRKHKRSLVRSVFVVGSA